MDLAKLEAVLNAINARLTAIEAKIESGGSAGGAGGSASDDDGLSKLAAEFDSLIMNGAPLKAVLDSAAAIGGDAVKLAEVIKAQFTYSLKIVDMAGKCKKPAQDTIPVLYKELQDASAPLNDLTRVAGAIGDAAKGCKEGVAAFTWVLLGGGTVDCVNNALEGSEFWHNKVRKASKDTSKPELMTFANGYRDALRAMSGWVKDNAKLGLTWNPKGVDTKEYKGVGGGAAAAAAPAANGSAAAAAAPAPAPAPAPAAAAAAPAPAPAAAPATPSGGPGGALGAVFAQLSSIDQSSGRTAGLKHVTKEMKTAAKTEPPVAPKAPTPAAASGGAGAGAGARGSTGIKMGDPKVNLKDGLRWEVEYHTKDSQKGAILTLSEGSMRQEVYIYGCKDVAIDITTKVKGVRIDQCTNVTVLVQSALSGVEVVNSKKMKIQCRGSLPSVAIDKTDGILVGLPWVARSALITSSKSSEMNVTFPVSEAEDADWVEQPIPEQFVSKINPDGKVSTHVSELYSS